MRRRQDAPLVALAGLHGVVLLLAPMAPVIAAGVWWNSNTIAHNFVHRPFFRSRGANRAFAMFQSALLGIPQTLWRERHMAHHAGVPWRARWSAALGVETLVVLAVWTALAARAPHFFLAAYLPGYLAGLGLCALQGHYEHAGAVTRSHYGRVYNLLCFNDGYHVEHHAYPGVHWSELPGRRPAVADTSRWPPLLRWIEALSLNGLETLVLHVPVLQRFVVNAHVRALAPMLAGAGPVGTVGIVGGGLFPRTALVIARLLPEARVVIIDAEQRHLEAARAYLRACRADRPAEPEYRHATFVAGQPCHEFDLVVVPLAFKGDRRGLYDCPPARLLLVHDWCWRVHGHGRLVSWLLLKRVNLVTAGAA